MPKKALTWPEFLDEVDRIMREKNKQPKSAQQGDTENPPKVLTWPEFLDQLHEIMERKLEASCVSTTAETQ